MGITRGLVGITAGLLMVVVTACGGAPSVAIPPTPTPQRIELTPAAGPMAVALEQPTTLGGQLNLRKNRDPRDLDPHYSISAFDNQHNQLLYSVLVKQQDRAPIKPDLAERWEIQDSGKKFTFHLRNNVRFHDGRPLTGKDVVYSLNRMMGLSEPERFASDRTGLLKNYIKDVQSPNDSTVVVELTRPSPVFLELLTSGFASILPAGTVAADLKNTPKGSGPWKLKEWVKGSYLLYEKNPNFYEQTIPYLDTWKNWIIPDPAASEAAFLTKKVDVGSCDSLDCETRTDAMEARGELSKFRTVGYGIQGFGFNIRKGVRGPWTDQRVRKAILLAFDPDAYIATIQNGRGVHTGVLSSGTSWGRPPEYWTKQPGWRRPKDQDRGEARRLMAEAGFPSGFEVELQSRSETPQPAIAELWADQLATIGIKAKIVVRDSTDIFARAAEGRYELWSHGFAFFTTDPDELLGIHFLGGAPRNYWGYDRPDWNALYLQMSQEVDSRKRKEMVEKLEDMAMEDLPLIPLPQGLGAQIWWPHVRNWNPGWNSYVDSRKDYVWIDSSKR